MTTRRDAAICFIFDGDRILLMQAGWAGNQWSVIGGKVEPGETAAQAVCREVFEETGLALVDYRPAGHLMIEEDDGHFTFVAIFVSTQQTGDLRGSVEGEPVWWPLSEADQLPMIDYVKALLPQMVGA
ncbi:MAG: hydrolase [Symbiobacteriaceae bacterium]|jgi:8-oxo-dGTP diphosphatase|nr:hydrolase [Symbiobacteriaceae bacterium]